MIIMSLFNEVSHTHQFPSYNFFGLENLVIIGLRLDKIYISKFEIR